MLRQIILASTSLSALVLSATAAGAQPAVPDVTGQAGQAAPSTSPVAPPASGANANAASPESAQAADSSGLADIVVTATRQATNLQSTPIAITAVTAETLQQRGLTSVASLAAIVPNATFRKAQGAYGPGVTAFIRGIGQGDTSLGQEPGVAYYVDDVYYPLLLGSNFDLLNLDHVEVLRGPQGTLFGRNALAGAVNLVSKQPDLTQVSGFAEFTTGAYHRTDLRAGINLPVTDTLAVAVSGLSQRRGGYQKVLDFRCQMIKNGTPQLAGNYPFANGQTASFSNHSPDDCTIGHLGGQDVRAGRGTLLWRPASNIKLTINGDYTRDTSENPADTLVAINPAVANANANLKAEANAFTAPGGPTFAYDNRFITGDRYATYATYTDVLGPGTSLPGSTFYNGMADRGARSFPPHIALTNWGVSGKLVYGVARDIDVTAIVAYRSLNETHAFDIDGSPLVAEQYQSNLGEHYTNAELRLSGKRKFVDWVVGLFYFHGTGYNRTYDYVPYSNALKFQDTTYTPTSKAAYANVTLHPISKLDLTLGGRYSSDRKAVDYSNVTDVNVGNIIFNVTPKDSRFDWKAGVDYHLADHTLVYASAATGFRLPGFNSRPLQADQVVSYKGDETLAYELGIKTDLFDRKLRINATGFYTDYKRRPISVSGQEYLVGASGQPVTGSQVTVPLPAAGAGATTCRVLTAAEVAAGTPGFQCIGRTYYVNTPGKVKGVELEAEATPVRHLSLSGTLGYSNFSSPDLRVATRANDRLAGIPNWTASAGIQYDIDVSALGGSITPRLDWFYQGSIDYSPVQNTYNQPGYSTFNLRVTYFNDRHQFSVSAGATNLFSKKYFENFFVYQDIGFPNTEGQPGAPRQWFLTVGKRF